MTQAELIFPPATHRADPLTSYKAEERITDSGRRQTQAERVLAVVRNHPRHTSAELARLMGADRYMVARRLPDLLHNNMVRQCAPRTCRVSGKEAMTWEAV